MTSGSTKLDLLVLSADLDIESALQGMLARPQAIGIRSIQTQYYRHPGRDPGCRLHSHEYLRSFINRFEHALVIFDLEGSGRDHMDREQVELNVEALLSENGWGDRAAVVVIAPEIEAWVWSDSPHVDKVCGWAGRKPSLRDWLTQKNLPRSDEDKPADPKKAFRDALRTVRKQPSASLFKELATSVSLQRCRDPAFQKFRSTLQQWFPKSRG